MTSDAEHRLSVALADRYRIERELGQGGMATVYLAHDLKHDRQVAVKVLKPELGAVLGAERFLSEIKVTANLQHPNLLPLFDSGAVDGLLYYVMPFVEGETLRTRLERERQLPVDETLRLVTLIAGALDYAHARGVVHRDLKPENILLQAGQPVIADFGIALAVAQAGGSRVTETGLSLGTPHYMSPEQATADRVIDARSDQYSLGAVTYEMLTGEPPHTGATAQAIIARLLTEAPRSVRATRPAVPVTLDTAILRALAKAPADRFASCGAFARAAGDTSAMVTASAPGSRVRRLSVLVLGIAVVAAAAWWWTTRRPAAAGAGTSRSIAVLPIENAGGDSTKEYLADGMTSELAGNLRQTPGIEVAGDLSTFRFKHSQLAPAQIAGQLRVGMLLTGKLQSQGNSIRLQMQLLDAAGTLLWSKQFDREMKDNFALQDEVAAAITSEMRLVLSPATRVATHAGRTENPEAHDLFMRGQFEKNKVDAAGLARAVTYFQQALKLDPDYAQAHAGLAFAYDIQADVYAPSHEYHTLALKEARLAVAADSLLAEGRVLLGFEMAGANWDFAGGLAEMNRGLALNLRSPDALFMLATFLYLSGNSTRALALADSLIQVDPLSALAAHLRAESLLWGGRYEEALRQKIAAKKLDPTVVLFGITDAVALRELGRLDESLAAELDARKLSDLPWPGLVTTYARLGRGDDAMREIRAMEARARKQWVDPDLIAMAYDGIGDRDHTMEWLEKAFQMKAYGVRLFLNWDMPWLRSVRDDPRFVALKHKVLATRFKE